MKLIYYLTMLAKHIYMLKYFIFPLSIFTLTANSDNSIMIFIKYKYKLLLTASTADTLDILTIQPGNDTNLISDIVQDEKQLTCLLSLLTISF